MAQLIYPFDTDATPSLTEVGGKSLSLIRTTSAGLPVPGGLALTVDFFDAWTEKIKSTPEWSALLENPDKERCDEVKELAAKLSFGDLQRTELERCLAELPPGDVFAVRSSSPEEDLSGLSFAGMYETYLGVTRGGLESTIAEAYSSMFDVRVMAYKAQNGMPLEGSRISVIVQRQIASDVSGVGFSLNPLNNCFDEAVIDASFGLGEAPLELGALEVAKRELRGEFLYLIAALFVGILEQRTPLGCGLDLLGPGIEEVHGERETPGHGQTGTRGQDEAERLAADF